MSRPALRSLLHLIYKRLQQEGPPPTVDELLGNKELVLDYLWPPALDERSKA